MKDHKTLMKSLDYIFPFTLLYFQCFFPPFLLLALFVFTLFTPVSVVQTRLPSESDSVDQISHSDENTFQMRTNDAEKVG